VGGGQCGHAVISAEEVKAGDRRLHMQCRPHRGASWDKDGRGRRGQGKGRHEEAKKTRPGFKKVAVGDDDELSGWARRREGESQGKCLNTSGSRGGGYGKAN